MPSSLHTFRGFSHRRGIVVGAHGAISSSGRFVGSTLDVDNAAFMSGDNLRFTGTGSGGIVNLGWNGTASLEANGNRDVVISPGVTLANVGKGKLTLRCRRYP